MGRGSWRRSTPTGAFHAIVNGVTHRTHKASNICAVKDAKKSHTAIDRVKRPTGREATKHGATRKIELFTPHCVQLTEFDPYTYVFNPEALYGTGVSSAPLQYNNEFNRGQKFHVHVSGIGVWRIPVNVRREAGHEIKLIPLYPVVPRPCRRPTTRGAVD